MKPLVSIICISYNQEKYIKQTIDGFLAQKVDFEYEIIIHDDASTDSTQAIIKEYIAKYPKLFRPILETKNQYSTHNVKFLDDMYAMAKGKYIAVCEGDDYWSDINKLQRQVDFLEKNKDYALCFHPVKVVFENGEEPDSLFPEVSKEFTFDLTNLLKTNYIQTNAVMYRRQKYDAMNSAKIMPHDWYVHLYHAQFGKIGFINDPMSVYRRHDGGVWWQTHDRRDEVWKQYGIAHTTLYLELLRIFGKTPAYRDIIIGHIAGMVDIFARIDANGKTSLLEEFLDGSSKKNTTFIEVMGDLLRHGHKEREEFERNIKKLQDELKGAQNEIAEIKSSKRYIYAEKIARLKPRLKR